MTTTQIMLDHGLQNVGTIIKAADAVGIALPPACALMTMESSGRNVYGNDLHGTMAGYPRPVNEDNFWVYWWFVNDKGAMPNGVGPCQLTFPGFIRDMLAKGQRPWAIEDNMEYGFTLIKSYRAQTGSWREAATRFNGSPNYGDRFVASLENWRKWLV